VVAAAKAAGLGFVAITDHNNLDAKPVEGYRDGVLVLVGTEISTTAGHILGLGIPDPGFRFSGDAQDALDDVRDLGGAAFAAHPVSPRPDFRFSGWQLPGPWGIELLNGDSQWREAGYARLGLTAALYGVNARYGLLRSLTTPRSALAEWDRLLNARDGAGIVGADAHSRVPVSRRFAPRFPSYESLFGLARNHVVLERPLSGDAAADGRRIVEALAGGRSYAALDALAPASDFSFTAVSGGRRYSMGETAAPDGLRLRAGGRMPEGTRLQLLKDGRVVAEAKGALDVAASGSGVYRVEAYVPGSELPWALTNPIYAFEGAAAAARARRAAWPEPSQAPPAASVLDDFEGDSSFAPEFDPASKMEQPVLVAGAGPDRSRAARIAFHLGEPGPGRPYTWCALVSRSPRDLTGRKGIALDIKADAVRRIWFQVRDANPASADAGEEWWFASLKATPEWRRVAVPFARLRSLNPKSDGRLDLDKVRGLVFVLDPGAARPGARGEFWIDRLGAY
jgi:hypothetical protein